MHILFIHQNYPAQFGHIAERLAARPGFRCTFVSEKPAGKVGTLERIQYLVRSGARAVNHFCSRTFENAVWHTHAVYQALNARRDIQPDLIVGHSGFGSTLFLKELYPNVPIINLFEYFYHTTGSDIDFRPEFPSSELARLRARTRNAMILLDLEACAAGYSPTSWQQSRLPTAYQSKVSVIHDGIDTNLWRPSEFRSGESRQIGDWMIPQGTRLVTYVSRGFESIRGFDIFMKMAKRLCDLRSDVVFAVVGEDRICYSGDKRFTGGVSFKNWVLSKDEYDLSRIRFLGRLPPVALSRLLGVSDLHIYLTAPFVLSWSLLNAMACGAPVLASDTPPVREVVQAGKTGLLTGFHDVDRWCHLANEVLDDPAAYRLLGQSARQLVSESYSVETCLPKMLSFFHSVSIIDRARTLEMDRLASPRI
jgi:glycosyltransferase involved in cell wall biosynthesis